LETRASTLQPQKKVKTSQLPKRQDETITTSLRLLIKNILTLRTSVYILAKYIPTTIRSMTYQPKPKGHTCVTIVIRSHLDKKTNHSDYE